MTIELLECAHDGGEITMILHGDEIRSWKDIETFNYFCPRSLRALRAGQAQIVCAPR